MTIFHKTKVPTVILRCLTGLNLIWFKIYNPKCKYFRFRKMTRKVQKWPFIRFANLGDQSLVFWFPTFLLKKNPREGNLFAKKVPSSANSTLKAYWHNIYTVLQDLPLQPWFLLFCPSFLPLNVGTALNLEKITKSTLAHGTQLLSYYCTSTHHFWLVS